MPSCEFCQDDNQAVVKIEIKTRKGYACRDCRSTYAQSYSKTFKVLEVLEEEEKSDSYIRMGTNKAHIFESGESDAMCRKADVGNTESFMAVDDFDDLPDSLKCGTCQSMGGESIDDILKGIREECDLEARGVSKLNKEEAKTVLNRLKYGI